MAFSFLRSRASDNSVDHLERLLGQEHSHTGDSTIQCEELGTAFLSSTAFGKEFLMRISTIIIATLFSVAGATSLAETLTANPNTKISVTSFRTLAQSCAPSVPVSTLEAIARTESALYPYALSINRPHQLAHHQGWNRGTITFERQPASREEAIAWTHWLLARGITVSIG